MSQNSRTNPRTTYLSRRQFGLAISASSVTFAGMTMASELTHTSMPTLEQSLQTALRTIGSKTCMAAADDLADRATCSSGLTFHLRNAGITSDGAALIADALTSITQIERARLRSFSLSYSEISDEGAIALASALPGTLGELGMVGCSITDQGAEAVRQWAANAHGLRMICIEGNPMSGAMRKAFAKLRQTSPNLAVFV